MSAPRYVECSCRLIDKVRAVGRAFCAPCPALLWLAVFAQLTGAPALAEILPTEGVFRGYYHVNAAGVGRFSFFVIPPALKDRFAPFDGKYIEVEVRRGLQPQNPGPVHVQDVGAITELNQGLRAELRAVPSALVDESAIDVIALITNVGTLDQHVDDNNALLSVLAPEPSVSTQPSHEAPGYTYAQLAFGVNPQPVSTLAGHSRSYATRALLRPGEAIPLVWRAVRTPPAGTELYFQLSGNLKPDDHPEAWLSSAAVHAPASRPAPDWRVAAQVQRADDWFTIDARLSPASGRALPLFVQWQVDPALNAHDRRAETHPLASTQPQLSPPCRPAGEIRFVTSDGQSLVAELDVSGPYAPSAWTRQVVEADGFRWRVRVRSPDHFSAANVARLELWLPTQAGLLPLVLAHDPGPLLMDPLPPWGPEVDRARLRIRMPRTALRRGEPIVLFYQADSLEPGRVLQWQEAPGQPDEAVRATAVLLDNQPAQVSRGGIGAGTVVEFPFQGEIVLRDDPQLSVGRHTLRLITTGDGGTYVDLRHRNFPKFEGTLESNAVAFEILPD